MINANQVKAARMMAELSQSELATASGLSLPTIQRMESAKHGPGKSSGDNLAKLTEAFQKRGVRFVQEGSASGVMADAQEAAE